MKIDMIGSKDLPVIVMIHAMYMDFTMFHELINIVKGHYCIVLPTLHGHEGINASSFSSVQKETLDIITFLKEQHIQQIELLLGVSLGGIIAFDVCQTREIRIHHTVIDGAPLIQFPAYKIWVMKKLFQYIAHQSANNPDRSNILDRLFPKHASHMKQLCGNMSDHTIQQLAIACYRYPLGQIVKLNTDETLTFLYGTKEKASMCIPRLEKFANCQILRKVGYHHCEFLEKEPQNYARLLLDIIGKE